MFLRFSFFSFSGRLPSFREKVAWSYAPGLYCSRVLLCTVQCCWQPVDRTCTGSLDLLHVEALPVGPPLPHVSCRARRRWPVPPPLSERRLQSRIEVRRTILTLGRPNVLLHPLVRRSSPAVLRSLLVAMRQASQRSAGSVSASHWRASLGRSHGFVHIARGYVFCVMDMHISARLVSAHSRSAPLVGGGMAPGIGTRHTKRS